jgi:hypothetical protein
VSAWSGSGAPLWSQALLGPTDLASPVLVPLRGAATDDVLVGSPNGLYPLDGVDGSFLFGTDGTVSSAAINPGCKLFNSVALADVPGTGSAGGWHVVEACGGPPSLHTVGEIASYRLPVQPSTVPAWPMFRGGPEHDGVALDSSPS